MVYSKDNSLIVHIRDIMSTESWAFCQSEGSWRFVALNKESFMKRLGDAYEYYYAVEYGDPEGELPLFLRGEFHANDVGYVLVKSARIWAAESNEYIYVFDTDTLDAETARRCLDYATEDGFAKVAPHKEHRETYIIAVFAANVIEPEARTLIRKAKYSRSYKHGFEGWSALRTAAVDLGEELVLTNKMGRCLEKFFKKLIRSEKV